jgi:hypothetical protein
MTGPSCRQFALRRFPAKLRPQLYGTLLINRASHRLRRRRRLRWARAGSKRKSFLLKQTCRLVVVGAGADGTEHSASGGAPRRSTITETRRSLHFVHIVCVSLRRGRLLPIPVVVVVWGPAARWRGRGDVMIPRTDVAAAVIRRIVIRPTVS